MTRRPLISFNCLWLVMCLIECAAGVYLFGIDRADAAARKIVQSPKAAAEKPYPAMAVALPPDIVRFRWAAIPGAAEYWVWYSTNAASAAYPLSVQTRVTTNQVTLVFFRYNRKQPVFLMIEAMNAYGLPFAYSRVFEWPRMAGRSVFELSWSNHVDRIEVADTLAGPWRMFTNPPAGLQSVAWENLFTGSFCFRGVSKSNPAPIMRLILQ